MKKALRSRKEKLTSIGQHALNIRIIEIALLSSDSEGKPIEGTEHMIDIIFNQEIISEEEVEKLIKNGMYSFDDRLILTDPVRMANLFPHYAEIIETTDPDGDDKH